MTDTPNADYQRGYAAGRRRLDREDRDLSYQQQRHLARYALAAAIAPKVLDSPWVDGAGTKLNTAKGIAGSVAMLVLEIEKKLG